MHWSDISLRPTHTNCLCWHLTCIIIYTMYSLSIDLTQSVTKSMQQPCTYMNIITMVADDLAPNRCQVISNHQADSRITSHRLGHSHMLSCISILLLSFDKSMVERSGIPLVLLLLVSITAVVWGNTLVVCQAITFQAQTIGYVTWQPLLWLLSWYPAM